MTSPWSSGADPSSIWNSNSPNLNLLRRYSLRSSSATKSTCSWEASSDNKYLIGYLVISRQDLEIYHGGLGFQLSGGKPTHDGQYGAIVEHVVPGSLMNIVCKLKVGDEIVEWNGFSLRNKRNDEVCDIIDSVKNTNSLRLVAVRSITNSGNNGTSNNNNNNTNTNNNNNTNTSPNNNNNGTNNSNLNNSAISSTDAAGNSCGANSKSNTTNNNNATANNSAANNKNNLYNNPGTSRYNPNCTPKKFQPVD